MKSVKLLAALALTTTAIAATAYYLRKRNKERKDEYIANAGYELAYDIHYPVKYSARTARKS